MYQDLFPGDGGKGVEEVAELSLIVDDIAPYF